MMQDRVRALAWWGTAYLVGGFSVVIWSIESHISPPLPAGTANAMLFVSCGMIWNAARLFHGRPVLWGAMIAGATLWFVACMVPEFVTSAMARIVLSSVIVSVYTFLTAAELWRERRKHLMRRWPAIFVPMLHGMVFLCPIPLASVLPNDNGMVALASGWIAVFALEVMLYIVGTAFIVLVLSKERAVRVHTGRRVDRRIDRPPEPARLRVRGAAAHRPPCAGARHRSACWCSTSITSRRSTTTSVMRPATKRCACLLRWPAPTCGRPMFSAAWAARSSWRSCRVRAADAAVAAERVREAFEAAAVTVADQPLAATVSVGVASGEPGADIIGACSRRPTGRCTRPRRTAGTAWKWRTKHRRRRRKGGRKRPARARPAFAS